MSHSPAIEDFKQQIFNAMALSGKALKQIETIQECMNMAPPVSEKQCKEFRHAIFDYMQKHNVEEGSHTFDIEVNSEIIEITFDASVESEFFGDGMNEERTCDVEVSIDYVEVNPMGLNFSTAQIMELENEVKLNC